MSTPSSLPKTPPGPIIKSFYYVIRLCIGSFFIFVFSSLLASTWKQAPRFKAALNLMAEHGNEQHAPGFASCTYGPGGTFTRSTKKWAINKIWIQIPQLPSGWSTEHPDVKCSDPLLVGLPVDVTFVSPQGLDTIFIVEASSGKRSIFSRDVSLDHIQSQASRIGKTFFYTAAILICLLYMFGRREDSTPNAPKDDVAS